MDSREIDLGLIQEILGYNTFFASDLDLPLGQYCRPLRHLAVLAWLQRGHPLGLALLLTGALWPVRVRCPDLHPFPAHLTRP